MALKLFAGDITHLKILGQHIVVLNILQAAQELLDKRSAIYSDRPPFVMSELYACHLCFLFCPGVRRVHSHQGELPILPEASAKPEAIYLQWTL